MTDHAANTARSAVQREDEKAGGEYKNVGSTRSVEQAGAEQTELEREAPIHDGSSDGKEAPAGAAAGLDPDAPGVSVLGLQQGQPVENNEPA